MTQSNSKSENPGRKDPSQRDLLKADTDLAKRCVAGEVEAWEEFYAKCHKPLLYSIKNMLRPGNADRNLVDELATRVWFTLIKDDGKLLAKYNSRRGDQLITFMKSIAKSELSRYFRDEKRREKRGVIKSSDESGKVALSFSKFIHEKLDINLVCFTIAVILLVYSLFRTLSAFIQLVFQ